MKVNLERFSLLENIDSLDSELIYRYNTEAVFRYKDDKNEWKYYLSTPTNSIDVKAYNITKQHADNFIRNFGLYEKD